MADQVITKQELIDARTDAKSLEEVVNGNDTKQVTTRLGESYPSVKKAVKTLFENGGLPAVPFKTKALMTASALIDGDYAQVTDDTVNNGLYVKTAGVWVKSAYDPITQAKAYADTKKAEIFGLIKDKLPIDIGITKQLTATDFVAAGFNPNAYTLYNGRVSVGGILEAYPNSTTLVIPFISGYSKVVFNIKNTQVKYAFWDKQANRIVGATGTVSTNPTIPANAAVLAITISNGGDITVDLDNDLVYFDSDIKTSLTTKRYVDNNLANYLANYLLVDLQVKKTYLNLNAAKRPTATDFVVAGFNPNAYTLYNGRVSVGGILEAYPNSTTLVIPVISGYSKVVFNIKNTQVKYAFWDKQANRIVGATGTVSTNPTIPANAAVLAITISNGGDITVDLDNDLVYFESSTSTRLATTDYVDKFVGSGSKSTANVDDYAKIMLGKKLYTFTGDDMRLYKESLFSGYNPVNNFSIEFSSNGVIQDRGRYGEVLNSGGFTVDVFDENRNLIDARISTIYRKPKPTTLNRVTTPQDKMKVLFIGDSLIHFNQNLIGKEWLRMLNTNQAKTVTGGVVYPATYAISSGNIELVGKQGGADNKFEYGNHLRLMMEHNVDTMTAQHYGNPFYYSDSALPDELDVDGWNKRVDITRYLQDVCGVGKHPDYIYIASGVNDIVDINWDIDKLHLVRARMEKVLKRLKDACDEIAGGNSDVQILLFNHQYYPLNRGAHLAFKPAHQRRVWTEHYRQYEDMVANKVIDGVPLGSFVRFVDCASSFDVDNGYAYYNKTVNPRSEAVEGIVVDTVHMGAQGAAMYADALLRDFLYHECV